MKKLLILNWGIICLLYLTSCSDDDNDIAYPTDPNNIGLADHYKIDRSRILEINFDSNTHPSASFKWSIKGKNSQQDSLTVEGRNFQFISLYTGTYNINLTITSGNEIIEKTTYITVEKEATPYSAYIQKVYDFIPAIGQFTNDLPKWVEGDSREAMITKANNAISGPNPSMISLGGFGGYIVFGFDHTIMNIPGERDFKVLGNAFFSAGQESERVGSCEPGIIMVSYDKNKNGLPDDEWYEIAGSEYYKNSTIKNYTITYYKPDPNKPKTPGELLWQTDIEHVKWVDNQGNDGYKTQILYHLQNYYPEWITGNSLSLSGTKLADNFTDQSGNGSYWIGKSFEYGYADNAPNTDEASNIDIDWAVDKNGNKINLPGIDFVRIHTGINQETGWLGEVSTEVAGAYDLHL